MKLGRKASLVLVIIVASAAIAAAFELSRSGAKPSPCTQPDGGFLIVASNAGYNDSVDRLNFTTAGGPTRPWPLINVAKGSTVKITVCNTDLDSHGFQIEHYYVGNVVSIAPGKAISLTFSADEAGTFRIFCQIPCPIHLFMQYGVLVVR